MVRSQIRALREKSTNAKSIKKNPENIGEVLASNMISGFALELGLKIFYMTYSHSVPRHHDLLRLYENMPQQIKDDVALSYAVTYDANQFDKEVKFYAHTFSEKCPEKPQFNLDKSFSTASDLFCNISPIFTQSRYYFETVSNLDWSIIPNPIQHMDLMSGVLDIVHEEYLKRGSWA